MSMGRSRDKGDKERVFDFSSESSHPSTFRKRKRKAVSSDGPQFEVTGQHVIIFVALVFTAAWFAGLLPDP